jgi:hypothetical protein
LTNAAAVMDQASLVVAVQIPQELGLMKMKNTKLLALALSTSANVQLVPVGGMLS